MYDTKAFTTGETGSHCRADLDFTTRLVMPGLHGQQLRVPLVRQGGLRVDIDRHPVCLLGTSPVPLVEFPDVAQHGVRLRVHVVQCQRFIRRLTRRRERVVRCSQPEDAEHHVRFRQARPCIGATGVAFDGFPKVIDRPSKVLHSSLAREVPRLQQRVANLGLITRTAGDARVTGATNR